MISCLQYFSHRWYNSYTILQIETGGRLPVQTFFILDEFANIGQVPDFDKKISTSRSRGIQFSVILQNLDQLEAVYEKSYETIIGNCDTHVFLGSNSQKTVEYFSKALGEKTVERTSISVNKDRQNWMQGKSVSDQINARALLTPDELRRFDNDYCIIFEKGIRPVKAKKYYYFMKPEAKRLAEFTLSHNEPRDTGRGEWRKYNPYNPYVPPNKDGSGGGQQQDLKVESLDDLFEDNEKESAPVLPQEAEIDEAPKVEFDKPEVEQAVGDLDLQKELEDKFDELFGPIDEL